MAQDIREAFVRLFGEKSPKVPSNKAELFALPLQQRMTVERALPEFYESLAADPASLPAAVSLRHSKGELTMQDIPALMAAGMPLTCNEIQQKAMNAAVAQISERIEEQRQQRELNQNDIDFRNKRAAQMSRHGYTGHV